MEQGLTELFNSMMAAEKTAELAECNGISAPFGLTLSVEQMQAVAFYHNETLSAAGRVEFMGGIMKKLVFAFCDSPYIQQEDYADTLCALLSVFYSIKAEAMDTMTDDETVSFMKRAFDGPGHGSLTYLQDKAAELCRITRGCDLDLPDESVEDDE